MDTRMSAAWASHSEGDVIGFGMLTQQHQVPVNLTISPAVQRKASDLRVDLCGTQSERFGEQRLTLSHSHPKPNQKCKVSHTGGCREGDTDAALVSFPRIPRLCEV